MWESPISYSMVSEEGTTDEDKIINDKIVYCYHLSLFSNLKYLTFQIEQHQQNLETMYGESIAEQEVLAARKDQTTRRLRCASVLSTALKDEMVLLFHSSLILEFNYNCAFLKNCLFAFSVEPLSHII